MVRTLLGSTRDTEFQACPAAHHTVIAPEAWSLATPGLLQLQHCSIHVLCDTRAYVCLYLCVIGRVAIPSKAADSIWTVARLNLRVPCITMRLCDQESGSQGAFLLSIGRSDILILRYIELQITLQMTLSSAGQTWLLLCLHFIWHFIQHLVFLECLYSESCSVYSLRL